MKQEIKDEALKQLEKDVLFGFEGEDELFESISEMFYDEVDFDDNWLNKEIVKQLQIHQRNSLNWEKPTAFERLVKIFDKLNKEKIVSLHKAGYTRQDGEGDCRAIIEELNAIGIEVKGYCYYHTQDLERAIEDNGMLFIGYDSHYSDDETALEVGNRIVELLKEAEFQVEWNGSLDSRIEIRNIQWKKVYDGVDYNYGRVFSIIENHHTPIKKEDIKKPFWKFW